MIPASTDTPVFFTRRPSWEFGVEIELGHETTIFVSRSGIEERTQRRRRSKASLRYQAVLTATEAANRDVSAVTQMNKVYVVPFWTERALTTTGIVANAVTIDRVPDADWFLAGDHAYLYIAAFGGQFREIASVAGSILTFDADGGAFAYPSGTTIYPCRRCQRPKGAEWSVESANTATEEFAFETL